MKVLKKFGYTIFAIVMLAAIISCKKDEEENPKFPKEVKSAEDCKLWSQVTFEGREYDVVKNSFAGYREPTEAEKAKLTVRYENDVILNKYIQENLNKENYILLFLKSTEKGDTSLTDNYLVLNEKADKIASARWLFSLDYIPTLYSNSKVFKGLSTEFIVKKK